MRIKCPHCNGKGFSEINSALNLTCGWCMGQGELDLEIVPTEPQTNDDIDGKEPMRDWGVCKDCALKENCAEYKPYKRQCEDYERYKEVLTNEEWFCQLPTKEKAKFLAKKCGDISCKFFLGEAEEIFGRYWVEWLKKPYQRGDTE